MSGALAGIRVIEFANYVSGPYAGMLLGDLGADIVKVEEPTKGDPFRGWGRVEYSPTFGSVNRNKKSVTVDLKSEIGKADARDLIRTADVVIENFRVGTMDRLGLGYEAMRAANPGVIWCSITGYGSDGPYAMRPGYDTVGQATSGLLSLLTDISDPKPMGISLSDHLAGITATNGILAALIARGRTGRGQLVETSLLESTLSFCGENAARFFENGKVPGRATRTHQAQVYAFTAQDGKAFVVHLSSPTKFWVALTQVAGHPEWVEDPRFKTKETRGKNYDALHAAHKTGDFGGAVARGRRSDEPGQIDDAVVGADVDVDRPDGWIRKHLGSDHRAEGVVFRRLHDRRLAADFYFVGDRSRLAHRPGEAFGFGLGAGFRHRAAQQNAPFGNLNADVGERLGIGPEHLASDVGGGGGVVDALADRAFLNAEDADPGGAGDGHGRASARAGGAGDRKGKG
jgi:formyl-CoA transferase